MTDRLYRAGLSIGDSDIELAGLVDDGILVPVEPAATGYWCDAEGIYFTDEQEHMTETTWRKRGCGSLGHFGYECEGRKVTHRVAIVRLDDE